MSVRQVIDGGYCIGCGACTAVAPSLRVEFNRYGDLVAVAPADAPAAELAAATAVCPFTAGEDETALARRVFADQGASWHDEIGMHVGTHAAYAPSHHAGGSSGGVATWLLARLLEQGAIDFALHVAPSEDPAAARFYAYRVSDSAAAVESGSTSFYYPVSMDEVLRIVKSRPGRYAVTGVPCFHKALRRLRAVDPVLDERLRYQIGIVCGQMKSAHYLEYLTHAGGAHDGRLVRASFRRKVPGRPANDYAFEAEVETAQGAREVVRVMNARIGINWGMGYFKPEACEVCDDVLAETADIAAMDAWLPQFLRDAQGWSLVVTRTAEIEALLRQAAADASLVLQPVSPQQVADSQRGGLNHRRQALPYRLWMRRSRWTPPKRFEAGTRLHWTSRLEQRVRDFLRQRSRELWLKTGRGRDFDAFSRGMRPYERLYGWVTRLKRMLARGAQR